MDSFEPINTALLVVATIVLGWYLRDRFAAIEKRFDGIDRRFDGIDRRLETHDARFEAQDERSDGLAQDIASLKASVLGIQGRLDEMSRELIGLRSDILQIALAVGARARPETA
jgi:hypothetical protein